MKEKTLLTERQEEILDFIRSCISGTGMPPTFREIGDKFDIQSTNGVRCLLIALEKKGVLKLIPKVSRGIQLSEIVNHPESENSSSVSIPLLGRIAAGSPIVTSESATDTIEFPSFFGKAKGSIFALRVQGNSMTGEGIFDGDTVIVESDNSARNGDIVAVLLNGEATVKTFNKTNSKIELVPANPSYKTIHVSNSDDFTIIGKIRGLVRKY